MVGYGTRRQKSVSRIAVTANMPDAVADRDLSTEDLSGAVQRIWRRLSAGRTCSHGRGRDYPHRRSPADQASETMNPSRPPPVRD